MLSKYIVGVNWADFLILAIIARMCFIGMKTGIGIEIFKIIGLWFSTIIACHFYTPVSDLLNKAIPSLPISACDAFIFTLLIILGVLILRIIRDSFFLLVKVETNQALNKWTGIIIGFFRGIWISSLILVIFTISTVSYLEASAKSSLTGHKLINIAPQIYRTSYEGAISKFFTASPINDGILKAVKR